MHPIINKRTTEKHLPLQLYEQKNNHRNQNVILNLSLFFIITLLCTGFCVADSSNEAVDSSAASEKGVWLEFTHERCQKDVLTSNQFNTFYQAQDFYNPEGIFELLVRFKGIADGHIILTTNATSEEPRYTIGLGTYNNRFSEIRRLKPQKVETKISTPSIMSDMQFRGFKIQYDPIRGILSVFGEGSEVPLLVMEDTNEPILVHYFSFATWHNRIVQVAFNCIPKDSHSTVDIRSQDSGQ